MLLNWRWALIAGLVAIAGMQTYRLQSAQAELAILAEREAAAVKAVQLQKLHDLRNKERNDAQYEMDLAAAHRAGLRDTKRTYVTTLPTPSASRPAGTVCYSTEQLNRELAAWAGRVTERFEGVARKAEEVAAAYRACRNYVLDAFPH